jgi:hypothetical protein
MLTHVPGNGKTYQMAMVLDLADYIEDGATQDDLLASITSQSKHKGQDGKPSYEEIISSIEQFVGLYVSDVRISYETVSWLEARGVKMSQANIDKLIHEGKRARIWSPRA